MARISIINNLRVVPRDADFLDRKTGARGEIFYDKDNNTLRVYDSEVAGGMALVKVDLSNVSDAAFIAKAEAAGVGGSGSINVGDSTPSTPDAGTIWFNTANARLYVYVNDGDSNQWIQPVSGTENVPSSLTDLGISDGTNGQVLTTNGAGGFTFTTISGGASDWSELTGTPTTLAGYGITDALGLAGGTMTGAIDAPTVNNHKIRFYFEELADLPDASTYHGMVAHVHATAKLYFAHGGSWNAVQNESTAFDGAFSSLTGTPTTVSGYGITDAQATLVSGTNIKTINGTSVLGTGDISIAGDTGNVTFTGNTIDSADSTALEIVPLVSMLSDLQVGNDLSVGQDLTVANNLTVQGSFSSEGSGIPEIFSDNEIQLTAGTRVELTSSPIKMASFSTAERDNLIAENGDIIYNSSTNKFQGYENGSWVNLI